jgi:uncharacterized protein with FMN-binding domain
VNRTLPVFISAAVAAIPGVAEAARTASSARTYVGAAVHQNYGPVQVTITVLGTRITKVTATAPKDFPESRQINHRAVPILDQEALAAQSASGVHKVSGASLTSKAFKGSLASAITQAGLHGA